MAQREDVEILIKHAQTGLGSVRDSITALGRYGEETEQLEQQADQLDDKLKQLERQDGLIEDFAQLKRGAQDVEQQFRESRARATELGRELATTENPSNRLKESFRKARAESNKLEKAWIDQNRRLNETRRELKGAGVDTRQLTDSQDRIRRETDEARQAVDRYNRELREQVKATGSAQKKNRSFIASLRGGAKSLAGFVAAGAGIGAVAAGVRQVLTTGSRFERYRIQLESLTGSQQAANRAIDELRDISKRTATSVDANIETYTQLKAFGLDPLDGTLQAVIDQTAKLGGGQEKQRGITLALGQAFAKQKLQGEEVLQLLERGVPVYDLLTKATGKSTEELQELQAAGELGRKEIKLLIEEIGRSAQGAAAKNADSFNGQLRRLKTNIGLFFGAVADTGVLDTFKRLLGGTAEEMGKAGSVAKTTGALITGAINSIIILVQSLRIAFNRASQGIALGLEKILELAFNVARGIAAISPGGISEKFEAAAVKIQQIGGKLREQAREDQKDIESAQLAQTDAMEAIAKAWDKAGESAEEAGDKAKDAADKTAESAEQAKARVLTELQELVERAELEGDNLSSAFANAVRAADTEAELMQLREQLQRWGEQGRASAAQVENGLDLVGFRLEEIAGRTAAAANELERARTKADAFVQALTDAEAGAIGTFEDLAADAEASADDIFGAYDRAFAKVESSEGLQRLKDSLGNLAAEGVKETDRYEQAMAALEARIKAVATAQDEAAAAAKRLQQAGAAAIDAVAGAETNAQILQARANLRSLFLQGAVSAREFNRAMDESRDRIEQVNVVSQESAAKYAEEFDQATQRARGFGAALANSVMSARDYFANKFGPAAKQAYVAATEGAAQAGATLGSYIRKVNRAAERIEVMGQRGLDSMNQLQDAVARGALSYDALRAASDLANNSLTNGVERARAAQVVARELGTTAFQVGRNFEFLGDQQLEPLRSAIRDARSEFEGLASTIEGRTDSLRDELDRLRGDRAAIEQRRFAEERAELEALLTQARDSGSQELIREAREALELSERINRRRLEDIRTDAAEQARANAQPPAPATPANPPAGGASGKVLRFELSNGRVVNGAFDSEADIDALIDQLEQAARTSGLN